MPDDTSYAPEIITPADLRRSDETPPSPDNRSYQYRILAEGDSWFSLGAVPSSSLLFELTFPAKTLILNLAYPGDTVEHMSSLAGNPDLRRFIHDERYGYRWDLILVSGGGNDLIDQAEAIIRKPRKAGATKPRDFVDTAELARILNEVQTSYRQLVATRDEPGSINSGTPIVTHTYDYTMPRNAPARFVFAGIQGPWLYPVFDELGIGDAMRVAVSKYLIDQLAGALGALSRGPGALPNFHVVDTRKTLAPAALDDTGNSNDWLNEIHPNHQRARPGPAARRR